MMKSIAKFIQLAFRIGLFHILKLSLKKVSLKEEYNLNEEIMDDSQFGTAKNKDEGVTNAAFGSRFVFFPLEYFAAILIKKSPDDVELGDLKSICKENTLNRKKNSSTEYAEEFVSWVNKFTSSFNSQNEESNKALNVLREEIFHNIHLSNTSTWTTSQALTVCYRLSSTYLAYYRYSLGSSIGNYDQHIEVTKVLLNAYFVRQSIAQFTTPIAEAYCHYKNNLAEVELIYGKYTSSLCLEYLKIDQYLETYFRNDKDSILEVLNKTILNYPFAYLISSQTKLSYFQFSEKYKSIPAKRLKTLSNEMCRRKFNSVTELIDYLSNRFNKPSPFEMKLISTIMFYATEGLIPERLIMFVSKRVITTKYRIVFMALLKSIFTGGSKLNKSYSNLPAIWSYGLNDERFNIDPAMNFFSGDAFLIAQNSFEPTLAGENGYVNIMESNICRSILIQTVFIKAIYWVWKVNDNYNDYMKDYEISYRVKPTLKAYKMRFEEEVLPIVFSKAIDLVESFEDRGKGLKILDNYFAVKFEHETHNLLEIICGLPNDLRDNFFSFCDLNYGHGF